MSTRKQRLAARLNGRKSRGPVTEIGREIASRNSFKHGLYASPEHTLLHGESPERYHRLRSQFFALFQPANAVEAGQVEDMFRTRWQLNRLAGFEDALINLEDDNLARVYSDFAALPARDRTAVAFISLNKAGSNFTNMTDRHATRLIRQYHAAAHEFDRLREVFGTRVKNEPNFQQLPLFA
jgi:hypothetical protein